MANEPSTQELLLEVCRRDPRYPLEAYEFLFSALGYIQHQFKEKEKTSSQSTPAEGKSKEGGPQHVTGQQLSEACRDLALKEFGLMARTVFQRWGINSTADFGELVYNLIGVELLRKTDTDKKEDFHNVYDLDKELRTGYCFALEG